MKRAIIYFLAGTLLCFVLYYLFVDAQEHLGLNLYYSLAYGVAWGLAYYLDNPKFSLAIKLGASLAIMLILVVAGYFIFGLELAVPAVIKFSIIFVAYYLMASFRKTKSLRQ